MPAGALSRAPVSADSVARGAFIALGAAIPVSTALDSILLGIILLVWLLAGKFRETAAAVRRNPVAMLACVWFLVHVLAAVYSAGTPAEIVRALLKATLFLLIPMALVLFTDTRAVRAALYAFMAAIAVTVALSYVRWAGLLPQDVPLLKDTGSSASVVFKYHLTQNLLVAFGAFLFAVHARAAPTRNARLFFAVAAVLSAVNVLVIGDGRTGQIVVMVLAVYYGGWWAGKKGIGLALIAIAAVGVAAYAVPGSSLQKRAALALSDAAEWRPGVQGHPSGVRERLEFYTRSLGIFAERPLLGVGSGGFAAADREAAARHGMPQTDQPHNEYLLQGVELGIGGPLLLLVFFFVQWREARRLPDPVWIPIARALVLMYAFGSFGTSMLNDHAETVLFVWMTAILFQGLNRRPGRHI
jgi:O-antigen ligase